MPGAVITPCEYARRRHQKLAKWRNRWTVLIFAVGSTVVLFLIQAILLFLREAWLPGSIWTLATVVSGVGTSWVLARRSEAVKEEEEAYRDVSEKCQDEKTAHEVHSKLMLPWGIR